MKGHTKFPNLFSPLTIGNKTLRNRIVSSPMGGAMIVDGKIAPFVLSAVKFRGGGGVSQFSVGETDISVKGGRSCQTEYDFSDYSEKNLAEFKHLVSLIHENGCVALTELIHCGDSKTESSPECPAMGASSAVNHYGLEVVEMDEAMIEEACEEFAVAAKFMKLAGYDGVIPHCGHGWLPHQFLSPLNNFRTDEYGGSVENRSRIAVRIMRSIRERCGDDFLIEARISGSELRAEGYTQEDIVAFCKIISPYVNTIHVSCGHYRDPMHTRMVSTMYHEHKCNAELAAAIRRELPAAVAVSVVGGVNSPEQAEEILASGKADVVVIGRQSIADPEFVRKTEEGREDEIIPCVRCMRCFPGPAEEAFAEGAMVDGCSVNPWWDRLELTDAPAAPEKKKVLIIGGGPAGLQAAITATERGHRVTLLEKSGALGGALSYTRYDTDKYDFKRYLDALTRKAYLSGADIRVNTELTPGLLDEIAPDVIFAAVGSRMSVPEIPGTNRANVMSAPESYSPEIKETGSVVVVLGSDYIGCESAIHHAKAGKKVVLLDNGDDELAEGGYRLHKHILRELVSQMVDYRQDLRCVGISDEGVVVEDGACTRTVIPADYVVYSAGRVSNPVAELQAMAGDIEFLAIGDCLAPRTLYDATSEGFIAAFDLAWNGLDEYMEQFALELPF